MLGMAPAFLIACFAALRLAKFNITASEQKAYFIGMPVPAAGIFVGSFPLLVWCSPPAVSHLVATGLQHKWIIYLIIALLCWLMVSKIKFIKMIPGKWNLASAWPQYTLIALTLISLPFLQVGAIPFAFILYVLLSLVYKQPATGENNI